MKRAMLSFVLVLVTYIVHAQTNKFEIGVEGGPDITNNPHGSYDTWDNIKFSYTTSSLISFSCWITGLYKLSDHFSIKTGLGYCENSLEEKLTIQDQNNAPSTSDFGPVIYDYLVFPLMARCTIGDKVKFFVNGGPYLDYFLKGTIKNFIISQNNSSTIYFTKSGSPLDFGATAGFGAGMNLIPHFSTELEARFDYTLFNLKPDNTIPSGVFENHLFACLLLGLRYQLGDNDIK